MMLNLGRVLPCTEAEGPGRRFCVWTQGCLRRCPGCCNQSLLDIAPRMMCSSEQLCSLVVEAWRTFGLEGVTFLGGEPMLQARGLAPVARCAHEHGLSVIVFTGYERAELDTCGLAGVHDLLAHTDVLVDGPYLSARPDTVRNWVGSANQRFHYLTSRYCSAIETDARYRGVVEIWPPGDGERWHVNGCPKVLQDFDASESVEKS